MGRHRTGQEKVELSGQARRLREAGLSRRAICRELGVGDELLTELLDGVPAHEQALRRRAKDAHREAAVALRRAGATYDEIAAELGVSKSSCSVWLRDVAVDRPAADESAVPAALLGSRDLARHRRREGALLKEIAAELELSVSVVGRWCQGLPVPDRARRGRTRDEMRQASRRYWERRNAERDRARDVARMQATEVVGPVTGRDLVLALAVSYWCEGAKAKPWNPSERVRWMNSDPALVTLFLAGLAAAGVTPDRIRYRLSIHASADEAAARAWWAAHVGVEPEEFQRSTLKRHEPTTRRKNTGSTYRGCLCVMVLDARALYQAMEGTVQALVAGAGAGTLLRQDEGPPSAVG